MSKQEKCLSQCKGLWKKKKEKKRVKVGHHGNNSVKFQAGWFSEGGVGVFGKGGKEKVYFLCSCLEKQEESLPALG